MPTEWIGTSLDQYRITRLVATSVTASILQASDDVTGASVTLKVPHLEYQTDPVFQANFVREERILRRLDHPHLLKVLTPRHKSRPYMVTEYVEGVSLRSMLHPHQVLETEQALNVARQLADTLVYLHGQRVIHRDLKPENLLVTPGWCIKVLDFGLALDRPSRRFAWLGSATVGTPDYMAPEQAKGMRGDERSDICALGVMLYEMLTGALPYPGDDPLVVMQSKLRSDPIPPSRFRPALSPMLEEIILHAIERRPARRYRTAGELRDDLRDPGRVPLSGRAVRLRPRTLGQQRLRWAVAMVALSLGVLGGLGALVWAANRYPLAHYQSRSVGGDAASTR
jgi:eukaryotic-like serine/threonine-protein kinase